MFCTVRCYDWTEHTADRPTDGIGSGESGRESVCVCVCVWCVCVCARDCMWVCLGRGYELVKRKCESTAIRHSSTLLFCQRQTGMLSSSFLPIWPTTPYNSSVA